MNIVVVTDTGVDVHKKWSDVKNNHALKKDDFTVLGTDYICYLDEQSYEISKDVKLIERVASEKVFAKSKMSAPDIFAILAGIMSVIIFMQL
jgi:hypothetical protein